MRKIIVSEMVSLDGFFAGPGGEVDWHVVDEEFNEKYAIGLLDSVDTLLFGRVTYELMAGYWPTPEAIKNDPIIADKMNSLPKIVFSKTLEKVDWNNARLVKEVLTDDVVKLKQQYGKAIVIFGSGTIVSTLTQLGLIDEYRLIVNPVILGSGKSLFKGLKDRLRLQLLETKKFDSGNVLLRYEPIRKIN